MGEGLESNPVTSQRRARLILRLARTALRRRCRQDRRRHAERAKPAEARVPKTFYGEISP